MSSRVAAFFFFFLSKDDRNFINKMSVHVYILETSSSISGEHQQHLMSQRKKEENLKKQNREKYPFLHPLRCIEALVFLQ